MLLTFTNIKDKVLDAATAVSVDMAQALGGDPKSQAIALGKALNDPIKGITALTRVGVTFTDEQKAQIQAMQEAGDMAGAQTVIINELNKEFGGSAKAAADATGGWSEFNGRMGEAKEALGSGTPSLAIPARGCAVDHCYAGNRTSRSRSRPVHRQLATAD
jgi:phage-related minor tail protein